MSRRRGSAAARRLGQWAELAALFWLLLKGYRLLDRRWRCGGTGELDLVMERQRMTIFVEVKARSTDLYGGAPAAVGTEKQRRIVRLAATYLSRHGLWERPCRFDVVMIEGMRRGWPWRMRHVRDAFRPDLGRQL